jgi:hypothetical protein
MGTRLDGEQHSHRLDLTLGRIGSWWGGKYQSSLLVHQVVKVNTALSEAAVNELSTTILHPEDSACQSIRDRAIYMYT